MRPDQPAPARSFDRAANDLRPVRIQLGALKFAEGSALIEVGDTKVLVAATIERRVPAWLVDSGRGWATAEYSMLPRATLTRSAREVSRGRPSGRTAEIQRLIGRSMRSVIDLHAIANRTLILDCDVLQADGGTRTAAITGAYLAAAQAFAQEFLTGEIRSWPLVDQVAAVSVGIVDGVALLDLDASEDQAAEVDFNVVATAAGKLVEVQGTGEQRPFTRDELDRMLDLGFEGLEALTAHQNDALATVLEEVAAARGKGGRRKPAPARDERELWGKP